MEILVHVVGVVVVFAIGFYFGKKAVAEKEMKEKKEHKEK